MGGEIEEILKVKFNKIRKLMYLINTDNFKIIWDKLSEREQLELKKYIVACKLNTVKKYLKLKKNSEFINLSVIKLRRVASNFNKMYPQFRIENYQLMNKVSLVKEIEAAIHKIKNNSK